MSEINNDKTTSKKNNFMKGLIEQLELVVIVFVVIVLIFSFAARMCQVSGDSMRDTLYNGENVIVSDAFYTPERGDIIVFHQTGESRNDYNEPIVKRVIGVAGDTVKVEHLRAILPCLTRTISDTNIPRMRILLPTLRKEPCS